MFGQNAFNNFGNTNANTQPASQSTTGTSGLFGGFGAAGEPKPKSACWSAGNTGGPSLFGAPAAPATTATNSFFGGGLGVKPASTGSIFGNASSTTQPATGTSGGGLFGGGLFGNTPAAQIPLLQVRRQAAPSLARTTQQQRNPRRAQACLEGKTSRTPRRRQRARRRYLVLPISLDRDRSSLPSQPLHCSDNPNSKQPAQQQQQQQQQQTTFGQSINPPTSGLGTFGGASTLNQLGSSLLGLSSLGGSSNLLAPRAATGLLPSQQHQADTAQGQFTNLVQRIEAIEQSWNSNSPNCRFQVCKV